MANGKTIDRPVRRARVPSASYLSLIRRFPLRPLNSDAELSEATKVLSTLLAREHLETAEQDYLEVLSDLVERYEQKHHPIATDDLTDAEILEHLLEAKNVTPADAAQGHALQNRRFLTC